MSSSYSKIDQEPNGRPIGRPAGTPSVASTASPERATNAAGAQDPSRADELAGARMDDEGAAQAHPPARSEGTLRSLWRRVWR
jgi:hypothetical protein